MVANRPDWCISRHVPGVPMSLFVHKETYSCRLSVPAAMEERANALSLRRSVRGDLDPKEILGEDADQYEKVPDTLTFLVDSVPPSYFRG